MDWAKKIDQKFGTTSWLGERIGLDSKPEPANINPNPNPKLF